MKNLMAIILSYVLIASSCGEAPKNETINDERPDFTIVIHGGAGTILKKNMTPEREKAYRDALNTALDIGEAILQSGGSSLEAVEKTINFMEDSELFNAGRGAVFTHNGTNEMDASIMSGKDQNAGAVGGVTNIKHPISAARAVLEKSEHVMMAGKGAEAFAQENGVEVVDPSYFKTERRWKSLQNILKAEDGKTLLSEDENKDKKHGTVGCVALDRDGNISAGTSTGGMTNKKFNRLGDSPIIGAGTYADNASCGVSCTGHGEYFIRYTVARDIAAMMEYGGKSLAESAQYIINEKLVEKRGTGGIVALDQKGNVAMNFNTPGMYRGYAKPGERVVKIYKDEK